MIEVKNISFSYNAPTTSFTAVKNISLRIPGGEITAVAGKTGSGKTTLAEILGGITQPDCGRITADGKIGIVFQTPVFFEDTVYNEIAYTLKRNGINCDKWDMHIKRIIENLGLSEESLPLSPFRLSGGEQKLVSLAVIIAAEPNVLILDEPTTGLDAAHKQCVLQLIRSLKGEGKTIVFVTHSMDDAADIADNIILINDAEIVAQGKPNEVLSDTDMLEKCGLDAPRMIKLRNELKKIGIDIGNVLSVEEAYSAIVNLIDGGAGNAT